MSSIFPKPQTPSANHKLQNPSNRFSGPSATPHRRRLCSQTIGRNLATQKSRSRDREGDRQRKRRINEIIERNRSAAMSIWKCDIPMGYSWPLRRLPSINVREFSRATFLFLPLPSGDTLDPGVSGECRGTVTLKKARGHDASRQK